MKQTYQHSPRPVGGPISFALKGDRLTVDSGRKVQEVRLGAVETVRMTYEPGRLAQSAFRTRVTMKDGKTFTFTSLNWKNLVQAEQMTDEYRAFTQQLLSAIARANPDARFMAGKPWGIWFFTSLLAAGSLLAMAYLIWRAFQMGATNVALLGGLFATVGIWQIEPMVRLNKPRPFRPDAPPVELLPGAS
ncbi:hypothetical protein [Microvirga alba]|uniref:Uncharacterized protein n=1 Tax=Microvirga alba TaxID=2791025 RepID=A0A931FMW6_9HYPH|nr:hypothetical protein [Microvirga alba]MBF9233464.1 hypothetical protein [Microvirga alba]